MKNNKLEINRITDQNFFNLNAYTLAIKLLGKTIVRNIDGVIKRYEITETECYFDEKDTASHAHFGKTNRTKVMWEKGGTLYIYLIYGIHEMLNIVSGKENEPMGVLIRGVSGAKGPGLVTKLLQIDKSFNCENIITSSRIWLENNKDIEDFEMKKRVGIDYAAIEDQNKLYRFIKK